MYGLFVGAAIGNLVIWFVGDADGKAVDIASFANVGSADGEIVDLVVTAIGDPFGDTVAAIISAVFDEACERATPTAVPAAIAAMITIPRNPKQMLLGILQIFFGAIASAATTGFPSIFCLSRISWLSLRSISRASISFTIELISGVSGTSSASIGFWLRVLLCDVTVISPPS